MLEAYEIGISLALQDGVSTGINLIRRDLATLDRAIAATSQNLAMLQAKDTAGLVRAPAPVAVKIPAAQAPQNTLAEPHPAPAAAASQTSAVLLSPPKTQMPEIAAVRQTQSLKAPSTPQSSALPPLSPPLVPETPSGSELLSKVIHAPAPSTTSAQAFAPPSPTRSVIPDAVELATPLPATPAPQPVSPAIAKSPEPSALRPTAPVVAAPPPILPSLPAPVAQSAPPADQLLPPLPPAPFAASPTRPVVPSASALPKLPSSQPVDQRPLAPFAASPARPVVPSAPALPKLPSSQPVDQRPLAPFAASSARPVVPSAPALPALPSIQPMDRPALSTAHPAKPHRHTAAPSVVLAQSSSPSPPYTRQAALDPAPFNQAAPPASSQLPAAMRVPTAPASVQPASQPFESAPRPQQVSFAPPSQQPPAITLQGDILLDGARVGRWMTSSLARQAARPPAGPTGPDPRQTPLWSGQAQGF